MVIAEFVTRDLRPISTADGKCFQQLHFVEPGYKMPFCPYLTAIHVHSLYSCLMEQLLETLASRIVAITTDLQTSKATEGYLTVTELIY